MTKSPCNPWFPFRPWLKALLRSAAVLGAVFLSGCPHSVGWSGGTETAGLLSWAEMTARMEADAGEAGPLVYRLTPSDESGPPLALRRGALPNCPGELVIDGNGKTLTLTGAGSLLTVEQGVTLTLRNITLKGLANNNAPLILVEGGGTLRLEKGGTIRDNKNDNKHASGLAGGGVLIRGNGIFSMSGGEIRENSSSGKYSGGVSVLDNGLFSMSGGEIRNNIAEDSGGGINAYTNPGGGVLLTGGTVVDNKAVNSGGGMYIGGQGTYLISGTAALVENISGSAGGVMVESGVLTMSGGSIRGNVGGGVYLSPYVTFSMSGGSISDNLSSAAAPYGTGVALPDGATFRMSGTAVVAKNNTVGGKTGGPIIYVDGVLTMNPAANISLNEAVYIKAPPFDPPNKIIEGDTTLGSPENATRFLINGGAGRLFVSGWKIN